MGVYKGKNMGLLIRIVETGEVFDTRTQCAEALGVSVSAVSMALNYGRICAGHHIEYIEAVRSNILTDELIDDLCDLVGENVEWRKHPYIPDIFVSDVGDVVKIRFGRLKLLNQYVNNSGYLMVSVYNVNDMREIGTTNSNVLVHRLVADCYIPNPYGKEQVNHIDGNKFNNCVWNLEWVSRSENMRRAFSTGLRHGERVQIVETGEIFDSFSDCAKSIGGTISGIHDCKSGRQKKHRGYHFRFLDEEEE